MAPNEIWSAKVADLVRRAAEFGMVKCPHCLQGPVFATLFHMHEKGSRSRESSRAIYGKARLKHVVSACE
jgi:hypothetical protein